MKVFEAEYKKYSEMKKVAIVARTMRSALDKAESIVKSAYGDRVLALREVMSSVEVAK